MRYDIELEMLEAKGIDYHRKVAKHLSSKIKLDFGYSTKPSILIIGEIDMIISRQLTKDYPLHLLTRSSNDNENCYESYLVFEEIHKESRIIPVTSNTFDFAEYDLIIFLFTNFSVFKNIFKQIPSTKFIFIPNYTNDDLTKDQLSQKIKNFFTANNTSYFIEHIDCNTFANNISFCSA